MSLILLGAVVLLALLSSAMVLRAHRRVADRDERASWARFVELTTAGDTSISAVDVAVWHDVLVARGFRPESLFAAGDLASLSDSAALRILEPPNSVPSFAERSPSASPLGTLDLAWVLIWIAPLIAIGVGYDAISRDRERGVLAMLLAPTGTRFGILAARAFAVVVLLWAGLVPCSVFGASLVSSIQGTPMAFSSLACVLGLLSAYALFLGVLVVVVSGLSRSSGGSLAVLFGGWILVSIAIPLAFNTIARSIYAAPEPQARMMGDLAAADVFSRPSASVLDRETELDPELDPGKGASGVTRQSRVDLLLSRERMRRARGARFEENRVLRLRAEFLELSAWLSPSTIVSFALSSLAGTAPSEARRFQEDGESFLGEIESFARARAVANETAFKDPEAWPKFSRRPPRSVGEAIVASAFFTGLSGCVLLFGGIAFLRAELAPTREDG